MKNVLVTGGAGFVGSHLIEHLLKNTDWNIVTLDRFDASGNPHRLSEMLDTTPGVDRNRVQFVFWDLKAEFNDAIRARLVGGYDYIIHLAAGSHVDRSIDDPLSFFQDNCIGTVNLLNYARTGGLKPDGKFHYFSTDEVFGPFPMDAEGGYKEWDRHNPNNPYAAAKSAGEMAVMAFANTYKIPSVITNCMNIMGERQSPEKFIPLVIKRSLTGEKVSIHADETLTQSGKRHYLHARNIAAATVWILENGPALNREANEGRYNIVGDVELDNLTLALKVHALVKAKRPDVPDLNYELVSFHASRPGHDLRYALDGSHLKDAGFTYPVAFEESLEKLVEWTLEHEQDWL